MAEKISGEGKTFRTLPDGRMLFRDVYADNATVVLTADEHDRIKRLRTSEYLLSLPILLPALPVSILAFEGRIAILTAAALLLPIGLLAYLVHVYFKRRQQAILQRAPISAERLPGFSPSDVFNLLISALPPRVRKRPLFYLGLGFFGSWSFVLGRFFGAGSATDAKAPSLLMNALTAVGFTIALVVYWLRRRGRDGGNSS